MYSSKGANGRRLSVAIFYNNFIHYHFARCLALKQLLASKGWHLFIYALRPQAPDRPISKLAEQSDGYLEILGRSMQTNSLATIRSLWLALDRDNPAAVVIPGYRGLPNLTALGWCKLKGRSAILLSDSKADDYPRKALREWVKSEVVSLFDAVLVAGSRSREYARSLKLSSELLFIGVDVVDNDYFAHRADWARENAAQLRNQYCLPTKYFVCVSRFIEKKNISGLLQAYYRYTQKASTPPWDLIICGSGYLEARLKEEAKELRIPGVHFTGYKDINELPIYFGLAGCLIIPSSHSEQWGLVVNEAMASGLPVLVSRVCGCAPDLVIEGINGYSFDPCDVEALSCLMVKMSSGEVDYKTMGEASRRIIADWTPETFARNLMKAIEAGLKAKRISR